MKVRLINRPDVYIVETWAWYWPFWTFRRLSSQQDVAEKWAKHYANPKITEYTK